MHSRLRSANYFSYWNSRSTFWSAWVASESAVEDSDWRVCNASRLAPSWLASAKVKSLLPVCSVLIVCLVKSVRSWMTATLAV